MPQTNESTTDLELCFLDTCAVLDLMRRYPPAQVAVEPFDRFLTAFTVIGELIHGAYSSRNSAREVARIEAWLSRARIIGGNSDTAYIYGEVIAELESRGQRIPTNDVWIAAVAIELDYPLVSRDAHFARVSGLRWIGY